MTRCSYLQTHPRRSRAFRSHSRAQARLRYLDLREEHLLSPCEVLLPLPGRNNQMGVLVNLENNRWDS